MADRLRCGNYKSAQFVMNAVQKHFGTKQKALHVKLDMVQHICEIASRVIKCP